MTRGKAAEPLPLVFLGPSLARGEAERLCRAEYQRPIRRGDLACFAGAEPRIIGIVDGVFHQARAVTPREILEALDAGHRVYGAASIGALRAVELRHAGMIGVGRVWAAYASGATERDDEVAVAVDPVTDCALSDALVSMRSAFRDAVANGLLSARDAERAVAEAEALYYPQRSYERVVAGLGLPRDHASRLLAFLRTKGRDLKQEDVRELLRCIARGAASVTPTVSGRPRWWQPSWPPRERLDPLPSLERLPPAPKLVQEIGRAAWLSETEGRLAEIREAVGITRVADVTALDTVGLPCFSAMVPGLAVSAFSGKGLEPREARIGAHLEALESALAYDDRVPRRRGTYEDLRRDVRILDPESLPVVCVETRDLGRVPFEWVPGQDLWTGEEVWAPRDVVFLSGDLDRPWRASSNGMAAGNCVSEALAQALGEVVERDAVTLQAIAVDYGHLPNLVRLRAGPPRLAPPADAPAAREPWYPFVETETLPEALRTLVLRVRRAGVEIDLRWVASDVAVPVFLCLLYEDTAAGGMTHAGSGAHPDAAVAARRALVEAIQSRATFVHGVREDLPHAATTNESRPTGDWFRPDIERIDFQRLPSRRFADVTEDVRYLAAALRDAGLREMVGINLSHPDVPLAVVKVLVPGAEPVLNFSQRRRVSLGWRARRLIELVSSRGS